MKITGVLKATAKKGLEFVNSTGEGTRKVIHSCVNKVTKKTDTFVKAGTKVPNKDTAVGSSVIVGIAALAGAAIKGIIDKVKEVKED